jgi:hypothetical protein
MEPRHRVVVGLSGAALALIVIGVAAIVFDSGFAADGLATPSSVASLPPSGTPRPSPSPTATPSASFDGGPLGTPVPVSPASPSASVGPSRHPIGFVAADGGFTYYADDGTAVPVKPVAGLEVRLQAGRAKYYALAGNRLGLKAGSYAGEFMPMVSMGQADGSSAVTGGIVLAGPAVSRLIADRLAAIESDADRWIVALPIDIRPANKAPVSVTFDRFGLSWWSNTPRAIVRFSGSLQAVEAVPANGGFHVLVEQIGGSAWQIIDPARLSLPDDSIDPAHAMNQLITYGDGSAATKRDIHYNGRVAVGSPIITVSGDVSISLAVNGSRAELGPDKILKVGDVPVFVAAG